MPGLDPRLTRRRRLVWVFAAVGLIWTLAHPVCITSRTGFGIAMLGNGGVFAVYTAAMYAVRGGGSNIARAAVAALFGVSHIFWMSLLYPIVRGMLPQFMNDEFTTMLAVTGIVLGVLVAVLSRRWLMLVPVAAGTAAAMSLEVIGASSIWRGEVVFGMGVGGLHIGLLAALVPDTLQRLSAKYSPRLPNACAACGYDLDGLVSTVCPECGTAIVR